MKDEWRWARQLAAWLLEKLKQFARPVVNTNKRVVMR